MIRIYLWLFLLLPVLVFAQPTWQEHTINGAIEGIHEVITADIDGDGDSDALYASYYATGLTWWENVDTVGTVWTEHSIDTAVTGTLAIVAVDMDGDTDVDIVSGSHPEGTVSWWENTDGIGSVWTIHSVSVDTVLSPRSLLVADINHDTYPDVICAADTDNDLMYWSNDNGDGLTWTRFLISDFISHIWDVEAGDINGDDILDLYVAAYWSDKLTWYKNVDSTGTVWNVNNFTSTYDGPSCIRTVDMEGDGDVDLLSASYYGGDLGWWENTSGNGHVFTHHPVSTNYSTTNIDAADVDADGDIDLLCGIENSSTLYWFENTDGGGIVWSQQTVGPAVGLIRSTIFCDIDGDTDIDILIAAGRTFTWWEQVGTPIP